jgi:hypothetical protein
VYCPGGLHCFDNKIEVSEMRVSVERSDVRILLRLRPVRAALADV